MNKLQEKIFNITTTTEFNGLALEIFHYQYYNNKLYRSFVDLLKTDIHEIKHHSDIPFLPIEFFKTHKIIAGKSKSEVTFLSSGTGSTGRSKHFVTDVNLYRKCFMKSFQYFYGNVSQYQIFALLPSYLGRKRSSLVFMINDMISKSQNEGGFYLDNIDQLIHNLQNSVTNEKKVLLFGVSYALLDLAEKRKLKIPELLVMETGGMKGLRKELVREELHSVLCDSFSVEKIHSEYGMTELLSQAYSQGNGSFYCPPWMKVLIRDVNDPVTIVKSGKTGGINIIDLANINSCSFIATQDLGKVHEEGYFEVLGRFDYSDIRGCNLLI